MTSVQAMPLSSSMIATVAPQTAHPLMAAIVTAPGRVSWGSPWSEVSVNDGAGARSQKKQEATSPRYRRGTPWPEGVLTLRWLSAEPASPTVRARLAGTTVGAS